MSNFWNVSIAMQTSQQNITIKRVMAFKLCTYILVDMRKPVLEKNPLYLQVSSSRRFVKGNGRKMDIYGKSHRELPQRGGNF